MVEPIDHGLEFLLAFDGRIHHLERGYWIKFAIKRVQASSGRRHGISYSLTLHGPDGMRIVGFDNAHGPPRRGPRSKRNAERDHMHRTRNDPGRPYEYKDAATLILDFFAEVERALSELDVGMDVIAVEDTKE